MDWLRWLHRTELPDQQRDRAVARETLRMLGNIVIRPIVHQLAETRELYLVYPIAMLFVALEQLDKGRTIPMLRPARIPGRPEGTGVSPRVRGGAAAAMSVLMEQGGLPPEEAGRIVARMLDKKRIRQRGGKPIEWTTINAWRKKIRARRRVTPEDADVVIYTNCRLPVALRTIIGWDKDGENAVLEPLPEPRTLAMEVLEFGLDYEKPLRLWGLDEVHE